MSETAKAGIEFEVKRAYEPPRESDGLRILVDRIWPRGVSKAGLKLDCWMKDLAPSDALRRWFRHDPNKWDEFRRRYFVELANRSEMIERLLTQTDNGTKFKRITLVFGAKDIRHNNAVALKDYLEQFASQQE
jgi:uncharacterized protein YeaO (DUF488 family)